MINPRGVKIVSNTVGFFIADDAEEVRRANHFCEVTSQMNGYIYRYKDMQRQIDGYVNEMKVSIQVTLKQQYNGKKIYNWSY